jgi:hypothetical protein
MLPAAAEEEILPAIDDAEAARRQAAEVLSLSCMWK